MTERNIHFIATRRQKPNRKGIVLILTIAILVILTTIVYSLSSRVSIYKRRQEYIINYQSARYACDSAMKYALTRAGKLEFPLIARQDSPDFSDLFALDHAQYTEMLIAWAELQNEKALAKAEEEGTLDDETKAMMEQKQDSFTSMLSGKFGDPNENESKTLRNFITLLKDNGQLVDANDLTIPGPYGPDWPLVSEPIEFEIGNAKVEIQFKDENAKFPLALALTINEKLTRQANDAVAIFCEWMRMDIEEIEILALQLEYLSNYKDHTLDMKPIKIIEDTPQTKPKAPPKRSTRRSSRSRRKPQPAKKPKTRTRPAIGHVSDFAKLLHSSIITTSRMQKTIPQMGERHVSPIKYLGMWGVDKVNVNTAPRQVLEAVFAFGGDQELIAEEIIKQRQIQPYKKVEELRKMHFGYSDSIDRVKAYLTTKSNFITVEVRVICGNAEASAVSLIQKNGKKATMVAMMSI